ncbi:MAG TPA: hypothetical protein VFB23_05860 [Candidatus Acidoferrales bacterium]|nr:hypothetical protein [Candidatus Acidoferrales bacterium]
MREKVNLRRQSAAGLGIAVVLATILLLLPEASAAAQSSGAPTRQEVIGRVSGDDVSVTGEAGFERQNGRTTALLISGSKLTLHSGEAKVDLSGVGDLILCGPADLSIVKSGPAITIALNYGEIHLQIPGASQITIYTPLLIVTPEAIGDRNRDLTIGLEQSGDLCITAASGATRIQEQFSSESVIIPQGGDMQIDRGELRSLRSGSRKCSCELLISQNNAQTAIQLSAAKSSAASAAPTQRPPEPSNEPIYRIDVPLTFNAPAVAPAGPTPEALAIIRESVSDPVSFRGVVRPALPAPPAEKPRPSSESHHSKLHFFARFFRLFRHQKAAPEAQSAAARS